MWVWLDDGDAGYDDSTELDAPLILNGAFVDPTLWDTLAPPF